METEPEERGGIEVERREREEYLRSSIDFTFYRSLSGKGSSHCERENMDEGHSLF